MAILHNLIDLFYPRLCGACSNALTGNEACICTACLADLPLTNNWNHRDNAIEKIFWGRAKVKFAGSFLFFEKKSIYQKLFHKFKYKGNRQIGDFLGYNFGLKLKDTCFNEVDLLLPVPLHKKKQRQRGFNQSAIIATGIARAMNKTVSHNSVSRIKANSSQTKKKRYERWENVKDIFNIEKPESLSYKHILIVDDIITTGATTESLIQEILKIPDTTVSVAVLASA